MRTILSIIFVLIMLPSRAAVIVIDEHWHIAGERMQFDVTLDDSLSTVAYVELSDTRGVKTGTVVRLRSGKASASLLLPSTLHSGFYRLAVYTRLVAPLFRHVAVINTLYASADDNIVWNELHDADAKTWVNNPDNVEPSIVAENVMKVRIEQPAPDVTAWLFEGDNQDHLVFGKQQNDSILTFDTSRLKDKDNVHISAYDIKGDRVPTQIVSEKRASVMPARESKVGMEREGHIVVARLHKPTANVTGLLSVVGMDAKVFAGEQVNDSTLLFHTYDVCGKQNVVASVHDVHGNPVGVDVLSPFEAFLPDSLPQLHFSFSRREVENRSIRMQQSAAEKNDSIDKYPYNDRILNTEPYLHYDLDEYRQFATVGEVLTEYVSLVHSESNKGIAELRVFNENDGYSNVQPLVLVDGMSTRDIDRLLKYDARRIRYINVYTDWIILGTRALYHGIVSFVTRKGDLTNYYPDNGSAYIVYDFPM